MPIRHRGETEVGYSSNPFAILVLEGEGWSAPRPGSFTPGKAPVLIVQEAGSALGPVQMGTKNLVPIGIRSPDRPARS